MSFSAAGVTPLETNQPSDINGHPAFGLGSRGFVDADKEWIFVQANGAIAANDVVLVDSAYQADQIDTTNSASGFGLIVGVAAAAFADNDYGWIQIFGGCMVNVATGAATGTALNSTATAGRIDDDATAGAEVIDGLVTTAAESGNAAAAFLTYPRVGATL